MKGEVVRSIPKGVLAGSPPGIGIQFSDLGEEGKRFIELVVQMFKRENPTRVVELPRAFLEEVDKEIERRKGALTPARVADLEVQLRVPDARQFWEKHAKSLDDGDIFIPTHSPRPSVATSRSTPPSALTRAETAPALITKRPGVSCPECSSSSPRLNVRSCTLACTSASSRSARPWNRGASESESGDSGMTEPVVERCSPKLACRCRVVNEPAG